ncbi:hypothetical protein [Lamprocystis purpurea]|jgi:hypothetical protein|nr:hypothetical protein [Lamprocystis purpurea]
MSATLWLLLSLAPLALALFILTRARHAVRADQDEHRHLRGIG